MDNYSWNFSKKPKIKLVKTLTYNKFICKIIKNELKSAICKFEFFFEKLIVGADVPVRPQNDKQKLGGKPMKNVETLRERERERERAVI